MEKKQLFLRTGSCIQVLHEPNVLDFYYKFRIKSEDDLIVMTLSEIKDLVEWAEENKAKLMAYYDYMHEGGDLPYEGIY